MSDKTVDLDKYQKIWKGWDGSETDFYIACHQLIGQLTANKFNEIIGEKMVHEAMELNKSLTVFNNNIIPDKLIWNPSTKIEIINNGFVLLSTALGNHKVRMTKLPLLKAFDGSRELMNIAHLAFRAKNNFSNDISKLMEIKVLN